MTQTKPAHAILSFSARKRWAACPVSLHYSKGLPDNSSVEAREGTLAHLIAEHYVRQRFDLPDNVPGDYPDQPPIEGLSRFAHLEGDDLAKEAEKWNQELRSAGLAYADYVESLIPAGAVYGRDFQIALERRVAATSIDDRLFGTADLLVWFPATRHLIVLDYKYGFMDVPVQDADGTYNPQLTAYLVAALDGDLVESATIGVFQPRRFTGTPGQIATLTKEQIAAEWQRLADDVAHVDATLALPPSIALCNPGEHCRYCRAAKGTCPAVIDGVQQVIAVAAGDKSLLNLPDDEVLALYALRTSLKAFFDDVTAKVETLANTGHPRVLRETRRGRRVFLPNARDALLALGLEECLVPGKVDDVARRIPAELHEGVFGRARDSVTIKVVDAPTPSETAKIFQKYAK